MSMFNLITNGKLLFYFIEESVRPVCLPAFKDKVMIGTVLTVAGWGKTPFGKLIMMSII